MNLSIRHSMNYTYSCDITLNAHTLRLCPRHTHAQKLLHFELIIDPTPAHIYPYLDVDDSVSHHIVFDKTRTHTHLSVTSLSTVHTQSFAPTVPFSAEFPMLYTGALGSVLQPFMGMRLHQPDILGTWIQELIQASQNKIWDFLVLLTQKIYTQIQKEYREFGHPFTPEETLLRQKGSCRDVTVLWMNLAQQVGFAVRFASGYVMDPMMADHCELHAWPEVWLPNRGWIGFDPSYGRQTDHHYIQVCAKTVPELCLPLDGSYTGISRQTLTTQVSITSELA
jgi:transglutaminase-like putative cysteine protease